MGMMAPPIRKHPPAAAAKAPAPARAPARPVWPWKGPGPGTGARPITPLARSVLQRKCAPGAKTAGGGSCPSCEEKEKKSWLQRKLSIGAVNDPLEHEADRVAEQVLSMRAPTEVKRAPPTIQRAAPPAAAQAAEVPDSVHRTLARPGRSLDAPVRRDMEQRFRRDFSQVRIHDGPEAGQSARDVGASAYTVGTHLVFGAAQFQPASAAGRRLLAHELVHVVQQEGAHTRVQRQSSHATGLGGPGSGLTAVSTPGSGSVATSHQGVAQETSDGSFKDSFYAGIIDTLRAFRTKTMNALRQQASKLPKNQQGAANTLIEIADGTLQVAETFLLAVIGVVVGFVEGIIGLIKGIISLVYGIVKLVYDLVVGIFTGFEDLKKDWDAVADAVTNLPSALGKLVDDWLERFDKAPAQRRGAMIGELVGQVVALIATFSASAARVGTVATVTEVGAETTTALADVVTTGVRVTRPLNPVVKGSGATGYGSGTAGKVTTAFEGGSATTGVPGSAVSYGGGVAPKLSGVPGDAVSYGGGAAPKLATALEGGPASSPLPVIGSPVKIVPSTAGQTGTAGKTGNTSAVTVAVATNVVGKAHANSKSEPEMPANLTPSEQKWWHACRELYVSYDSLKKELPWFDDVIKQLKHAANMKKASPQDIQKLCGLIDEQISILHVFILGRWKYMINDCDHFDWRNEGKTKLDRQKSHKGALDESVARLNNLQEAREKNKCP